MVHDILKFQLAKSRFRQVVAILISIPWEILFLKAQENKWNVNHKHGSKVILMRL